MILQLTDCGEDTCEAEVIHSIQWEKVVQKLLPFFLTAQESITLVKFPSRNKYIAILSKKHQVKWSSQDVWKVRFPSWHKLLENHQGHLLLVLYVF